MPLYIGNNPSYKANCYTSGSIFSSFGGLVADHNNNIGFSASSDCSPYHDRYFGLSMYCDIDEWFHKLLVRLAEDLITFTIRLRFN